MDASTWVRQRQLLWAQRHGLTLTPGPHKPGQNPALTRTEHCDQNLFEPLSPEARSEFEKADGGELNGCAPKFHSVYSSAALATNLFHYWRTRGSLAPIADACGLPTSGIQTIAFEAQLPIAHHASREEFTKDPNLDVVIRYATGSPQTIVAIECKHTEAYSGRGHGGLRPPYLNHQELWDDLPKCRELAERISPEDTAFPHLHPAQLLKHILGLKYAAGGTKNFRLLYLWYDVPFDEGAEHRREIHKFSEIVRQDGINFQAITYQEVIIRLAKRHRQQHMPYVDYLTERYL